MPNIFGDVVAVFIGEFSNWVGEINIGVFFGRICVEGNLIGLVCGGL